MNKVTLHFTKGAYGWDTYEVGKNSVVSIQEDDTYFTITYVDRTTYFPKKKLLSWTKYD